MQTVCDYILPVAYASSRLGRCWLGFLILY